MPVAAYQKFDTFVGDLGRKAHNLNTDVLKIYLTNTLPVRTNTVFGTPAEIAAGNGYPAGGYGITNTFGSNQLSNATVLTVTAAGGAIGPFRYAVLYNSTNVTKPLIAWWDYGSALTIGDGDQLNIQLPAHLFGLGFTPPSGLIAWYNMDLLTGADGSGIYAAPDLSGNGLDLVGNGPGGLGPILKVALQNGRNVARFHPATNYPLKRDPTGAAALRVTTYSWFASMAWKAFGSTVGFLSEANGGNGGWNVCMTDSSTGQMANYDPTVGYHNLDTATLDRWDVIGATNSTPTARLWYRNGVVTAGPATSTVSTVSSAGFAFGSFYAGTEGYPLGGEFDLGEFLMFDHVLTDDEIAGVNAYLNRWR